MFISFNKQHLLIVKNYPHSNLTCYKTFFICNKLMLYAFIINVDMITIKIKIILYPFFYNSDTFSFVAVTMIVYQVMLYCLI